MWRKRAQTPDFHPISECLDELRGADLEIWYIVAGHAMFGLRATGALRGEARLMFSGAEFIDLPVSMHDVLLRIAGPDEIRRRYPDLFPEQGSPGIRGFRGLSITCHEGTFLFTYGGGSVQWEREVSPETLAANAVWRVGGASHGADETESNG